MKLLKGFSDKIKEQNIRRYTRSEFIQFSKLLIIETRNYPDTIIGEVIGGIIQKRFGWEKLGHLKFGYKGEGYLEMGEKDTLKSILKEIIKIEILNRLGVGIILNNKASMLSNGLISFEEYFKFKNTEESPIVEIIDDEIGKIYNTRSS